jgi:hypothetical protein
VRTTAVALGSVGALDRPRRVRCQLSPVKLSGYD